MYSLMSMRVMAASSSNRKAASACASSVLPTPVGPRKTNEPIGRLGSLSPARARRTASETAVDGLVLADDLGVEALLHVDELVGFALHQAASPGCRSRRLTTSGDLVARRPLSLSNGSRAASRWRWLPPES